jgi:hypothetical protein
MTYLRKGCYVWYDRYGTVRSVIVNDNNLSTMAIFTKYISDPLYALRLPDRWQAVRKFISSLISRRRRWHLINIAWITRRGADSFCARERAIFAKSHRALSPMHTFSRRFPCLINAAFHLAGADPDSAFLEIRRILAEIKRVSSRGK